MFLNHSFEIHPIQLFSSYKYDLAHSLLVDALSRMILRLT